MTRTEPSVFSFDGFVSEKTLRAYLSRAVTMAIGYDDPVTLGKGEGGSSTAAPIFADFMGEYHRDLPEESFVKPDSVIQLEVDAATGLLPSTEKNRRKEVFLSGTQPVTTAPLQEESNAQDWMMRQLSVPSDEPIDDVGSEDEF